MTDRRKQTNQEWLDDYEQTKHGAPGRLVQHLESQAKIGAAPSNTKKTNSSPSRLVARIVEPEERQALIPEGAYSAKCCCFRFAEYWGTSKLILQFEISEGGHAGTRLECYFNLERVPTTNGEFVFAPKPRSAYLRLMRQLFGEKQESGSEWLDPDNLVGRQCQIEVETVTANHSRQSLGCNQYSKVKPNFSLIE